MPNTDRYLDVDADGEDGPNHALKVGSGQDRIALVVSGAWGRNRLLTPRTWIPGVQVHKTTLSYRCFCLRPLSKMRQRHSTARNEDACPPHSLRVQSFEIMNRGKQ